MRIAIPEFNKNIGSERIPFYVYKKLIEKYFNVEFINYKSIKKSDIVFLHGDRDNSNILQNKQKTNKYILFKPHKETAISCSGVNLFKRIFSYLIFFIKNKFSNKYKNNKYNFQKADLLVCDTPRISRFYSSFGYKTVYCSLIDEFDESVFEYRNQNQNINKNEINILYTGNLSHFNSNISQLINVLLSIKRDEKLNIKLDCLSGSYQKGKNLKRGNINLNIQFYKYSKSNLVKLLKKCDLGWVPNSYSISRLLNFEFVKIILTSITQKFDIIKCEKFSSNAGRSIIFAQYGIPFITNPNEETINLFNSISDLIFYENKNELTYLISNLLQYRNRISLSKKLKSIYDHEKYSFQETKKLFNAILKC